MFVTKNEQNTCFYDVKIFTCVKLNRYLLALRGENLCKKHLYCNKSEYISFI